MTHIHMYIHVPVSIVSLVMNDFELQYWNDVIMVDHT